MEDEAVREKRRIKILERLKKEANNYEEPNVEPEIVEPFKENSLSAHEKYKLLKTTEKKEVLISIKNQNFYQFFRKIIGISPLL